MAEKRTDLCFTHQLFLNKYIDSAKLIILTLGFKILLMQKSKSKVVLQLENEISFLSTTIIHFENVSKSLFFGIIIDCHCSVSSYLHSIYVHQHSINSMHPLKWFENNHFNNSLIYLNAI